MRIVVADSAIHFAEYLHSRDTLLRTLQACHHVRHFLAQSRRAGRLTVGSRHHGHVGIRVGDLCQLTDQAAQCRQQYLITRGFQHHAV